MSCHSEESWGWETVLTQLNDELCSFERMTGRKYTLILVPNSPDEQIMMSESGKLLPLSFEPEEVLAVAMKKRNSR